MTRTYNPRARSIPAALESAFDALPRLPELEPSACTFAKAESHEDRSKNAQPRRASRWPRVRLDGRFLSKRPREVTKNVTSISYLQRRSSVCGDMGTIRHLQLLTRIPSLSGCS